MAHQWKLIRTEDLHNDPWSAVLRKTYRIVGGDSEEIYMVLEKPEFALAAAIDERDRILLVRQYRHGTDRSYWSLPGGFVDPGETPSAAARRELLEETGYLAHKISCIAALHPMPGCLDSRGHIVLCEDLKQDPHAILDDEIESSDLLPLDAAIRKILTGEINEMQAVAAILLAQEFLRQREGNQAPRSAQLGKT